MEIIYRIIDNNKKKIQNLFKHHPTKLIERNRKRKGKK